MRRWFRSLYWGLLAGSLLFVLVGFSFVCAATYRPDWYRPASVDLARLDSDKAALINLTDQISRALNEGREISIRLTEVQVNRWLASRYEWPEGDRLDFGPLTDPQITFLTGDEIRFAARTSVAGADVVVALRIRVGVDQDQIVATWVSAQVGALPAPQKLIARIVRELGDANAQVASWLETGALRQKNALVWPNGRAPYRLGEVRITDDHAEATLVPLPRR